MEIFSSQCDEPLSLQMIRIIVCGLKIIGLAPFSVEQIKRSVENSRSSYCTTIFLSSKVGMTYNIILSILSSVLCPLAVPQLFLISYPYSSPITRAIDVMLDILRASTSCVIIALWAFRQKLATSIMNRLVEVDRLFRGMNDPPSNERTSSTFLVVHIIFDALLWITFWATEQEYINSFTVLFVFNVPIFLMHWFVLEYSIIVGLLARQLQNLNTKLLKFDEFRIHSIHTSLSNEPIAVLHGLPTHSQLRYLDSLQSIRNTLSDVSEDIAEFFSFPMLLVVASFSITLVYNIHYLITPLVVSNDDIVISANINLAMWMLACVYPLGALCFNIRETLKKAKQTGQIVSRLLAKSKQEEIQKQLHVFCIQLMNEDFSFTAYGFFPLDFTLIQSIFAATVTYLVIIVQFMQSAAPTSNHDRL